MRASLWRLHSPDVRDLATYRPERPDDFGFLLQVFAGPEGGQGEDSFDVVVCTPKWLEQNHACSDVAFGRHYLIVFEYDYDRLFRTVEQCCDAAEGATWQEVAHKLSRLGKWEFEDYCP
jgi:hypothetical protein